MSTYSNLKIELMVTGQNATTWGNVANANLGTAIEEAIVGSANVAFSTADVTLSLTDTNATQTARNLRLNLTGTPASDYNLIVPSILIQPHQKHNHVSYVSICYVHIDYAFGGGGENRTPVQNTFLFASYSNTV